MRALAQHAQGCCNAKSQRSIALMFSYMHIKHTGEEGQDPRELKSSERDVLEVAKTAQVPTPYRKCVDDIVDSLPASSPNEASWPLGCDLQA